MKTWNRPKAKKHQDIIDIVKKNEKNKKDRRMCGPFILDYFKPYRSENSITISGFVYYIKKQIPVELPGVGVLHSTKSLGQATAKKNKSDDMMKKNNWVRRVYNKEKYADRTNFRGIVERISQDFSD